MSKPQEFENWPDTLAIAWEYRAVCKRIVDGDTLYVSVDQGFNNYAYESIRLAGVNAPELFSGDDRVAGARARDRLAEICPPETKLKIITSKDRMTFGRYIASVKLQDGSVVNDVMIDWLDNGGI